MSVKSYKMMIGNKMIKHNVSIVIKNGLQWKAGRERLTSYQSEDPMQKHNTNS